MHKKFLSEDLLIGSNNDFKYREIKRYIVKDSQQNIKIYSPADFDLDSPEENGNTFLENAKIKAVHYSNMSGIPTLADDSGLCIDLLNGMPGIHTADWFKNSKSLSDTVAIIQKHLQDISSDEQYPKATAKATLALFWPKENHFEIFEGQMQGHLDFSYKHCIGDGFQPIFIPSGCNIPYSQLNEEVKAIIGHRGQAFSKLLTACF